MDGEFFVSTPAFQKFANQAPDPKAVRESALAESEESRIWVTEEGTFKRQFPIPPGFPGEPKVRSMRWELVDATQTTVSIRIESSVVAFEFVDDDTIVIAHVTEAGKRTEGQPHERWRRARGSLVPARAVPRATAGQ